MSSRKATRQPKSQSRRRAAKPATPVTPAPVPDRLEKPITLKYVVEFVTEPRTRLLEAISVCNCLQQALQHSPDPASAACHGESTASLLAEFLSDIEEQLDLGMRWQLKVKL